MNDIQLAFLLSNSSGKVAILSGKYDDENAWSIESSDDEHNFIFEHKSMLNLICSIDTSDKLKYTYSIIENDKTFIQMFNFTDNSELSSRCRITELIGNLLKNIDNIEYREHDNYRSIKCKYLDNYFEVEEITTQLIRGTRKTITIKMYM